MPTTRLRSPETTIQQWRTGELPALTTLDRIALRLGVALILWGQRHAEQALRTEQARRSRATDRAASDRDAALTRRTQAGPTW